MKKRIRQFSAVSFAYEITYLEYGARDEAPHFPVKSVFPYLFKFYFATAFPRNAAPMMPASFPSSAITISVFFASDLV